MPIISQSQMLVLFVSLSLFAIPAALILKKLGRHPAWALLCFVPVLAVIGLWVLALSPGSKSEA
jgi:hypothetical protein